MTENQDITQEFITVYRGVPSVSFPELLNDTTWRTRWIDGEDEARWVVPEDEQPYMEIGIVALEDISDPNWDEGFVTIVDLAAVDVQELVMVDGCITAEDVRAEFARMFGCDDDSNADDSR